MSVVQLRTNLKAIGKELLGASLNIYKVAGHEIVYGIWSEFYALLEDTAQWTGSTVASYNIDTAGAGSFGRDETVKDDYRPAGLGVFDATPAGGVSGFPRQAGDIRAIGRAVLKNRKNLDGDTIYKKVLTSGINVWNDARPAKLGIIEQGPLRDVNQSSIGAFARFEARIRVRVFDPIPHKLSLKDFNIMAESIKKTKGLK